MGRAEGSGVGDEEGVLDGLLLGIDEGAGEGSVGLTVGFRVTALTRDVGFGVFFVVVGVDEGLLVGRLVFELTRVVGL